MPWTGSWDDCLGHSHKAGQFQSQKLIPRPRKRNNDNYYWESQPGTKISINYTQKRSYGQTLALIVEVTRKW